MWKESHQPTTHQHHFQQSVHLPQCSPIQLPNPLFLSYEIEALSNSSNLPQKGCWSHTWLLELVCFGRIRCQNARLSELKWTLHTLLEESTGFFSLPSRQSIHCCRITGSFGKARSSCVLVQPWMIQTLVSAPCKFNTARATECRMKLHQKFWERFIKKSIPATLGYGLTSWCYIKKTQHNDMNLTLLKRSTEEKGASE